MFVFVVAGFVGKVDDAQTRRAARVECVRAGRRREGREDGCGQARRWEAWVWSAEEEAVICESVACGVNGRVGWS